jgi:hypothetical protein
LEALEDLGITSPIGSLATQSLPQLYARVVHPDLWWNGYKWEFFFIDRDADGKLFENVVHEERICYGRFGKPTDPPDYDLAAYTGSVEVLEKAFGGWASSGAATGDSYPFKTWYRERQLIGGFIPAVYYRCVFADDGKIVYEHVCGGRDNGAIDKVYELFKNGVGDCRKDAKPYSFGAARKTLDELRKSGEDGYLTGEEIQKYLGTLQSGIDYTNNRLHSVVTQVAALHGEMEQSFAVATAIIETTGESRRRVLTNAR